MGHGKSIKFSKRAIPSPIRKGKGILSKLALGAVGMFNISFMKGANTAQKLGGFERYMQDMTSSKTILNLARVGLASGTSRMQNMGYTHGLSNALSRTRHGGI